MRQLVAVDELRVAEDARRLAEEFPHRRHVLAHLRYELRKGFEGAEGVVVGFRKELHPSRTGKVPEGLQHVLPVLAALVQEHAGEGVGNAEIRIRLQQFQHQPVRGQVALLRHLAEHRAVLVPVEVLRLPAADIPDPQVAEAVGLVDLEVERDQRGHGSGGRRGERNPRNPKKPRKPRNLLSLDSLESFRQMLHCRTIGMFMNG